jgi:hypothetical protein
VSPGGRGHSAQVVKRARELREAGWSLRDTARIMRGEGMPVATSTIFRWSNPKGHRKEVDRAARNMRRRRAAERRPSVGYTIEFKLERMIELRERGVSHAAIGQVAAVWWGEELTGPQVRGRLAGKRKYERRKAAA